MDTVIIPAPFRDDEFEVLRYGVFDDDQIDVLINRQQDFAYLSPLPQLDYSHYTPRVKKLGLSQYKAKLDTYVRRYHKIAAYLEGKDSLLDIGAGDGLLLSIVKDYHPALSLAACEKDKNTHEERRRVVGDENFSDLAELIATGRTFSVVTLFHVLEHILDPAPFLENIRVLLTPESILIIEIPSLTCPLLTLYRSQAYQAFYFQRQHPFNYSHNSLQRLLEFHGFHTLDILSFQRYGIENHLNWLIEEKPGGNAAFREILEQTHPQYIADLERAGHTDSAMWVGRMGEN